MAAQRNNQVAVQFFHKYCPDMMKLRDKEGRLPVHILAFNGSIDTLQAICKDGKQPLEEKDFMNASLAHHASAGGQVRLSLSLSLSLSVSLAFFASSSPSISHIPSPRESSTNLIYKLHPQSSFHLSSRGTHEACIHAQARILHACMLRHVFGMHSC